MITSNNKSGPVVLISKEIAYTFPFGYAYLAGYLLSQGEQIEIVFRSEDEKDFERMVQEIIDKKPLMVGMGSLYPDLYPVKEIIRLFKEKKADFPIFIGGQMVTPTPEFAAKITGADCAVIGEGEVILHQITMALRAGEDICRIKGLVVNDGGNLVNTGAGDFIQDMKDLPPIPYHLFPADKWLYVGKYYVFQPQPHWRYHDKVADIHGGRGCPFTCNFCYHHSSPRYRPMEDMMKDAKMLIEKYDVNMLNFGDDLVVASPHRAKELVEGIKSLPKKIEFTLTCRFDVLNRMSDELLGELKAAGLRNMGLGVESGSQNILDTINKRITVEQIRDGFRRLKKFGVFSTGCIQIGQLGETNEDVQKSMDLMLETLNDDRNINWSFTITTPFPGTELYDIALKKGLLRDDQDFFNRFNKGNHKLNTLTVNLSAMTDEEIKNWEKKLISAYKGKKKQLIGKHVWFVERLRMKTFKLHTKLQGACLKISNKKLSDTASKSINYVHDSIQGLLDFFRLKFLGVK